MPGEYGGGGGGGGYGGGSGFGGGGGFSSGPSDKQLAFVFSLMKRLTLTEQQVKDMCKEMFKAEGLEGLSRGEASELIDSLKTKAEELGVDKAPLTGPASEKQIKFMKSLKRKAKMDDEAFKKLLVEHAKVDDVEKVGKQEASAVIDQLIRATGGTPQEKPAARSGGSRFAPRAKKAAPAPAGEAPPTEGGAGLDERPPERPDDGPPPAEDEDLPF